MDQSDSGTRGRQFARSIAILLFGIIVPLALMFQAYTGISQIDAAVGGGIASESTAETLAKARETLRDGNDYSLFAMLSAERVNHSVVISKQRMKIVVMQIGFAVASIGLMFIMLGINDGGGAVTGQGGGIGIDFKTGSTGALVFVVGAAMATAGGVLKNEYHTADVPQFGLNVADPASAAFAKMASRHAQCAEGNDAARAHECFYKAFRQEAEKVEKAR